MKQIYWNWWFVITIVVISFGLSLSLMLSYHNTEKIGIVLLTSGIVSLIPCLHVGLKKEK